MSAEDQKVPAMPQEEVMPAIEEVVTRQVIESIIKDYDPNMEVIDFAAKVGTNIGDNYMSIMYAVDIQLRSKSSGKEDSLSIMLKTLPRNEMRIKMINDCQAFVKEGKMYNEIFKDFENFQREKGIPESELFKPYPLCYSVHFDNKTDYLAMENLKTSGYRMADRKIGTDINHAKLVMEYLGKIHAISYSMFKGSYKDIKEKYPYLQEQLYKHPDQMDEMTKMFLVSSLKNAAEEMKKYGYEKEAEDFLVTLKDEHDYLMRMNKLIATPVEKAVVGLGDCWVNNFMFAYENDDKSPKTLKFLDFQLNRTCSRMIDIGYFLHTSTPINILNNETEALLKIYLDHFTSFGKKLGCDESDKAFDFDDFLQEFYYFKFYGFNMGMLLSPMMMTKSEAVPDLEEMSESVMNDKEKSKEFMSAFMGKEAIIKLASLVKHHLPLCKDQ